LRLAARTELVICSVKNGNIRLNLAKGTVQLMAAGWTTCVRFLTAYEILYCGIFVQSKNYEARETAFR
jgi:hypothetical protein